MPARCQPPAGGRDAQHPNKIGALLSQDPGCCRGSSTLPPVINQQLCGRSPTSSDVPDHIPFNPAAGCFVKAPLLALSLDSPLPVHEGLRKPIDTCNVIACRLYCNQLAEVKSRRKSDLVQALQKRFGEGLVPYTEVGRLMQPPGLLCQLRGHHVVCARAVCSIRHARALLQSQHLVLASLHMHPEGSRSRPCMQSCRSRP